MAIIIKGSMQVRIYCSDIEVLLCSYIYSGGSQKGSRACLELNVSIIFNVLNNLHFALLPVLIVNYVVYLID